MLAVLFCIGERRVHPRARPVRAAIDPDPAGPDLGVHRVDELADRHVRIVAVHEVDVDDVRLQPVERLGQLPGDDVGIAERRMRALADEDDVVAHAARCHPLAEQPVASSQPVDPGAVEDVAAGLVEGVAEDGRLGVGLGMSAPPSASTEASRSIPGSFRRGIRLDGPGKRPPVELGLALARLLEFVLESDRLPPRVERPHVAERVGPGHARRIEFLLAGADRIARGIDLEGVEPARLRDRDRLGVAVLAVNDDLAGAALLCRSRTRNP